MSRTAQESGPQETDWGEEANCYAYAVGCRSPAVSSDRRTAIPGAASGSPASLVADAEAYIDNLVQGVLNDGGGAIRQLPGDPSAVPTVGANERLIALLSGQHGFHFMARNPVSETWSWKDGNAESVKLNVFDLRANAYVDVTDAVLNDMLSGRKNDFMWRYVGMDFRSFFAVDNGATVSVAA